MRRGGPLTPSGPLTSPRARSRSSVYRPTPSAFLRSSTKTNGHLTYASGKLNMSEIIVYINTQRTHFVSSIYDRDHDQTIESDCPHRPARMRQDYSIPCGDGTNAGPLSLRHA